MTEGLGDFFKLIAENKQEVAQKKQQIVEQKRQEEQKQLDKIRKEEETINAHIDMGLDNIFEQLGVQPKKERTNKKPAQIVSEERQKKEEFDKLISSVISIGGSNNINIVETVKEEELVKDPKLSKEEKEEKVLTFLESFLTNKIDDIEEIKQEIVEEEEKPEEPSLIERSLGLLSEPSDVKMGDDPLTPLDQNFATLDDLQKHYRGFLTKIQQQLSTLGGGGETRLEFLDDVDRDTALVDGKFLKYEASSGKFVGATGGGGSSYSGTSGQILQHNGTDYVGVSSLGLATYFNDQQQGYYRYSTNYYTTGVANTVQNLPADEFVLIQPSVRTNKVDFMPQVMLDANNNDPWIGAGATIGTGQTQFSLAGLDDGSTVIVRIASQIDPDVDNTNVDFALNFTTNPTTQSFGTTYFSITKEQALICNEGADQNYISETLFNFYVGSSLSGLTTTTAGSFNISVRASDECDFEMMALTINVVA